MELIRVFSPEQFRRALDGWQWLPGLCGKTPSFASPFGDVFLLGADGWWFLDLLEGELRLVAADRAALDALLGTTEGQDQLLLGGLALAAEARGIVPGPDQVLAFTVPPVIGGPTDAEHLHVLDFVVTVDLAGQLHQQVRDMPPGTRISGITLEDR